MNLLVIGGGGREHALVWKLRQSPRVRRIYCAPGNAGIGALAELLPIAADDIPALLAFARAQRIDLTIPGPELPLTLGIVDEFERHGLRVFGPTRAGAQLEGSKAFTKDLMRRCHIPTGFFGSFTEIDEAVRYIHEVGAPIVVKADGLAAGKGVIICQSVKDAEDAVSEIMRGKIFGDAGNRVVIEEFLEGEEVSFMAITDGQTVLPLASSQDHKRIGDGDTGPNTGGMGAYSPAPIVSAQLHDRIMREVMTPIVTGLRERGIVYKGVLYAGLMIHNGSPKVLEFNARFGDPECQALLLRLKSDLLTVLEAVVDNRLADIALEWDTRAAACVVLAADGYPGTYSKGQSILGLDRLRGWRDGVVFHSGTATRNGDIVTNGGRVLGVTALGSDIAAAVAEAYRAVKQIEWDGMYYRRDIGRRALERSSGGASK
ncbi:MAG: phosphoribosylamine--glycine ligase [Deltaproteobacteria bacterium]|nr:phosphoribosylamine--glycine ligase [Deltaproteobacteria bacterium]MBI3386427.1 phosphoribosylamine--glycine ligase [Deltaproteobacteria bacterium]